MTLARRDASEAELSWRFSCARVAPAPVCIVALSELALAVGFYCTGYPLHCVIWLALLAGFLVAAYLPSDYVLGPRGITRSTPFGSAFHHWGEFRGFRVEGRAVKLLRGPLRAEAGPTLRAPHNLNEVVACVEGHLSRPAAEVERDEQ